MQFRRPCCCQLFIEQQQILGPEVQHELVITFKERDLIKQFDYCFVIHANIVMLLLYANCIIICNPQFMSIISHKPPLDHPFFLSQNPHIKKEGIQILSREREDILGEVGCGYIGSGNLFHNSMWLPNRKNQNLMSGVKEPYQKVLKTFVFEKEENMQSLIVDLEIDLQNDPVDLTPIFTKYCPLKMARITVYDPTANDFIGLRKLGAQKGFFARYLMEPTVILVRYRQKEPKRQGSQESESNFQANSTERKDMRSRQRTVAEAIDLVKRWRGLHLTCAKPNNHRKKVNLQQAAKMLGVSKKSLDDYYCQLRLAEQFGFDFQKHLQDKMGVLRSYVKDQKGGQDTIKAKLHRHPKNLRIIEDFELESRLLSHASRRGQSSMQSGDSASVKATSEAQKSLPDGQTSKPKQLTQINYLEQQFFRGFEFLLDDPSDPFLALNKDFSKRVLEDQSDGILFF